MDRTARPISWDLYRTFLAVLAEGSLSGAARSLGLTQPTAGRHVEALEAALGQPMFVRSQRGLVATEAALALRPYAEAMASTVDAMLREASSHGDAVRGAVRVTASETIGTEILPPIVAALHARYPELELEIAATDRVADLARRDADIAVRMTEPAQEALVVRRLGEVALGFHAHRRYLARAGTPANAAELVRHTLIGYDHETPAIRAMRSRAVGAPELAAMRFALRASSDMAILALLRAGAGISICQVPLAARDPNLVRVLPKALDLRLGMWLAMHENLRASPRCRVVFDALADGLLAYLSPSPIRGATAPRARGPSAARR